MNLEHDLCEYFCDGIQISEVPAGFAVSTAFEDKIGDRIAFYIVRDEQTGLYRLEDDGSLVPELLAMGTKVTEGQRGRVFATILGQSRVTYDEDTGELKSPLMQSQELPQAALGFVSMMMRVSALSAMNPEIVRNTFRDDAIIRITQELGDRVQILTEQAVSPSLGEFIPDVLLSAPGKMPVAVFIAVSDARLYEAIFLRMAADHETKELCSVVALLDRDNSRLVTGKMRQRALNRLDATPVFYGAESEAIARIAKEIPTLRTSLQ
ncbi:MAG: DUF1828 domain-containing protein [Alphaproteobacteria bacterium]